MHSSLQWGEQSWRPPQCKNCCCICARKLDRTGSLNSWRSAPMLCRSRFLNTDVSLETNMWVSILSYFQSNASHGSMWNYPWSTALEVLEPSWASISLACLVRLFKAFHKQHFNIFFKKPSKYHIYAHNSLAKQHIRLQFQQQMCSVFLPFCNHFC